jgi:hypothetical protein
MGLSDIKAGGLLGSESLIFFNISRMGQTLSSASANSLLDCCRMHACSRALILQYSECMDWNLKLDLDGRVQSHTAGLDSGIHSLFPRSSNLGVNNQI